MARPPYDSKWWGWGSAERSAELPPHALELLKAELGDVEEATRPVSLDEVRLPDPQPLPQAIRDVAGDDRVLTAVEHRIRHAAGRSYPDLIRLRSGELDGAPDAVVTAADESSLDRLLEVCAAERVAVVPFGGGTSVVGGVDPVRGELERVIALDLSQLRQVQVDSRSLTATLGAGLRGPEAESALSGQGFTLGHFPQSFELATIGGFAATRSAGQASSGYGRFDALVGSLRMHTPRGELSTVPSPHTAAGPSLREVALGSEGVLGVISDVTVRIRPAPAVRRYEGWMVEDFEAGREVARELAQRQVEPDVLRLSDEDETRVSLAMSGAGQATKRALGGYLKLRRRSGGCMVIAGYEGSAEDVDRRRGAAARVLRAGGGVSLGTAPGRAWAHGRYEGPYLRDALMGHGVLVETLETSHTWSGLDGLYAVVRGAIHGALEAQGTPGVVMCHVSHVYEDGASLYFTFLARARAGEEIEQWRAVKSAASEAIVGERGTITHHHAVGRDHAPYMAAEVGELGLDVLRAVKNAVDPAGIMNPGKLIPE